MQLRLIWEQMINQHTEKPSPPGGIEPIHLSYLRVK